MTATLHIVGAGVSGLANRADPEETWSVMDRLKLRTVLRGLSSGQEHCQVRFVDGSQVAGRVGRVGGDFFELHVGERRDATVQVVPVAPVTAVIAPAMHWTHMERAYRERVSSVVGSPGVLDPFSLPFFQRGVAEVLVLSVGAGVIGTWIVLRGLAFFAHAVGTATFPGLVLADGLGFAATLGELMCAVAEDRQPENSAADAARSVALVLAAAASADAGGAPVRVGAP